MPCLPATLPSQGSPNNNIPRWDVGLSLNDLQSGGGNHSHTVSLTQVYNKRCCSRRDFTQSHSHQREQARVAMMIIPWYQPTMMPACPAWICMQINTCCSFLPNLQGIHSPAGISHWKGETETARSKWHNSFSYTNSCSSSRRHNYYWEKRGWIRSVKWISYAQEIISN